MSDGNEEALAFLRSQAEAADRRYAQVLGEISAKKEQLGEAMATLQQLGCASLAEADQTIADLQTKIDTRLGQITKLLG